jgi:hypothetical protein
MTLSRFSLLLTVATALLTPAYAVDVSYSTTGTFTTCTGSFTCSGGSQLTGPNSLTISYTPVTEEFPNITAPPPSSAQFGAFTATGPTPGNSDTGSANFTLTVTQELPTLGAGTETFSSTLTGTITKSNAGTLQVNFTGGSGDAVGPTPSIDPLKAGGTTPALKFSFGDVTYWVDEQTSIIPQSGGGVSTITGAIDAVPEPTFYGLTAMGFAGLLFMAVRRKRQDQVS